MRIEQADPKNLMREAYRIAEIGVEECRTVFLDWALGLPPETDTGRAIKRLLAEYGAAEDHPMTLILRDGLEKAKSPARRGGRQARLQRDK